MRSVEFIIKEGNEQLSIARAGITSRIVDRIMFMLLHLWRKAKASCVDIYQFEAISVLMPQIREPFNKS